MTVPPKKRITLPDHVRAAVLQDIALTHQQALDAEERDKIRIYLGTEQGLDTYEIAERLKISQTSVSKYARQGKEALARREAQQEGTREPAGDHSPDEDPFRPGEREPVS